MKRSQAEPTTAKNLEAKFDRGKDVLDYFDVPKARVIPPQSASQATTKGRDEVRRDSNRRAAVREKSARYRKKK